eukprot:TRINITY_DN1364_c0_g1_i1.p1 TRINITY_DN1364_c0_g1~~TRINITY_DN1364_c0_g1_i1.p1  ORF type:complete len:139 (+),score=32.97 TRINITY_DN1364_c0_g1_i1:97-513(+)
MEEETEEERAKREFFSGATFGPSCNWYGFSQGLKKGAIFFGVTYVLVYGLRNLFHVRWMLKWMPPAVAFSVPVWSALGASVFYGHTASYECVHGLKLQMLDREKEKERLLKEGSREKDSGGIKATVEKEGRGTEKLET